MKSFSPAGAATKAYYGLGARTFGNPDGARTGGGAYSAGGANINGPNQGGGGAPLSDMTILAAAGGLGGSASPLVGWSGNNGVLGPGLVGSLIAGVIPWTAPGNPIQGIGDSAPNSPFGASQFVISVFGALPQNAFTSVLIVGTVTLLFTATATNFDNGGGCGPNTIWAWTPVAGLLAGHQYAFKFT